MCRLPWIGLDANNETIPYRFINAKRQVARELAVPNARTGLDEERLSGWSPPEPWATARGQDRSAQAHASGRTASGGRITGDDRCRPSLRLRSEMSSTSTPTQLNLTQLGFP